MHVRAGFAELAFWAAVGLVAIASVIGFVIVARGPLGASFPPARKLVAAI